MTQFSVDGVLDALAAQPARSTGAGRALMLIAARPGEGVTTAARAVVESVETGSVYAIDLDLKRSALVKTFEGPLGPRIDGALSGALFYSVRDARGAPLAAPASYFFHRLGRTRRYVGAFEPRALPGGARVVLSNAPDYWDAARTGGATVVVDAPALARSQIGLRVAAHMDAVVLVVGSTPGAAPAAMSAKAALVAAGAPLIGIVYAGATAPVMAIERLLRQAG